MTAELEALARAASGGDAAAWHALWTEIEPIVWGITGKWQITGPMCRNEDDRREIVVRVMERLRADGLRRLRAVAASSALQRPGSFRAWVTTVATRVAIDYVRSRPEHLDPRNRGSGRRWVEVLVGDEATLRSENADPLRMAAAEQMLDRAKDLLTRDQMVALWYWLDGGDHEVIAHRMRLGSAQHAERLLRAGLKRLRDRYRDANDPVNAEDSTP
ncbi:MAG: sigma-70 family RNA polymerase sigma factor [Polyangiaceae bacterium]